MEKNEALAEQKKRIRREALAKRDRLTKERRKAYSDKILASLTQLSCYTEAAAVLTYVSFRSEVDTVPLIKQAHADGKAVFAPRVIGRDMEFYQLFSVEELIEGYRGILEPKGSLSYADWISQERKGRETLICLPGAAFDRARHRIGYGGGFYDRYLSRLSAEERISETAALYPQVTVTTAALAFSCQILEKIPWEAHDIRPELIVTEKEIF